MNCKSIIKVIPLLGISGLNFLNPKQNTETKTSSLTKSALFTPTLSSSNYPTFPSTISNPHHSFTSQLASSCFFNIIGLAECEGPKEAQENDITQQQIENILDQIEKDYKNCCLIEGIKKRNNEELLARFILSAIKRPKNTTNNRLVPWVFHHLNLRNFGINNPKSLQKIVFELVNQDFLDVLAEELENKNINFENTPENQEFLKSLINLMLEKPNSFFTRDGSIVIDMRSLRACYAVNLIKEIPIIQDKEFLRKFADQMLTRDPHWLIKNIQYFHIDDQAVLDSYAEKALTFFFDQALEALIYNIKNFHITDQVLLKKIALRGLDSNPFALAREIKYFKISDK
ncbi:MAG: hypothetical protein JSS09_07230, partial [Verrucomicrobia bacterium]|nr:hypothetical protein [Verrucomicrobiota bacterium]